MSSVPARRRLLAVLTASILLAGAAAGSANAALNTPPTLTFSGLPNGITAGAAAPFDILVTGQGGVVVTTGCASTALITVTIANLSSDVTAVAGDAAFTDAVLPLSQLPPGSYDVAASATVPGCFGAVATTSLQVIAGTTCPPAQACSTPPVLSPGGSAAVVTAGPGAMVAAAFVPFDNTGPFTACAGESEHDPNYALSFNVTGSSVPNLIKDVLPGVGLARMCWHSPDPFTQRGGTPAPADVLGGYTGLLPNCVQAHPTLPCVLAVLPNTRAGTTTVLILAPAGDPQVKG